MIKQEQIKQIIDLYEKGLTLEQVGKQFNVTGSNINYHLKKNGIKVRRPGNAQRNNGYTIDKTFFENIDSHEKAAIFGFLCADGCNDIKNWRIRVSLHSKDVDYLYKINKYIQPTKNNGVKVYEYKTKDNKIHYRADLFINSIKVCKDLDKLGCAPNKSLTLEFPEISDEFLCSFMAGYFDGDGCICYKYQNNKIHNKRDYYIEIASSDSFCYKAKNIIQKILNINIYLLKKGKISTIKVGGNNQVEKFMDWIYSKSSIKLNRKYEKYLDMKNHFNEFGRRKSPII